MFVDIAGYANPSNTSAPAPNTAAIITFDAIPLQRHVIKGIAWSLNAAPAAPVKITITDGCAVVFSLWVTAAGSGSVDIDIVGSVNSQMILTLPAAGAAVEGTLNVLYKATTT